MTEKLRILVLDDDRRLARTLVDILALKDCQAEPACSGPQALEKAKQTQFDRFLTDIRMPEMNGVEVLKEIRARYSRLPVILVTGCRQEMSAAIQAALEIGAYTCLYKPLQIDELLQALAELHKRDLSRILGRPMGKG